MKFLYISNGHATEPFKTVKKLSRFSLTAVQHARTRIAKVAGSEGCVSEVFAGFLPLRFCTRGLDGTGSTRGIKKVPVSGDSVPKVPKITLCALKVCFCTLQVIFCTLKVYFCTLKVCSCTLNYNLVLGKNTCVR